MIRCLKPPSLVQSGFADPALSVPASAISAEAGTSSEQRELPEQQDRWGYTKSLKV